MKQDCKFNPLSDIEETIPDLAPDISEMMFTHTVPSTSSVDTPYSNVKSMDEVGHYLRDSIDIAMAQYKLNLKMSAPSETSGSTSGENS